MAVKQMHVNGARLPKGSKYDSGLAKCCACIMIVVVMVFFVSLGGTLGLKGDNVRSGQALGYHPKPEVEATPPVDSGGRDDDGDDEDEISEEYKLEVLVEESGKELVKLERQEVSKEEEVLSEAMEAMEGVIRGDVEKLLGDEASEQEVDEIVEEVEENLFQDVTDELELEANNLLHLEVENINNLFEDGENTLLEDGEDSGVSAENLEMQLQQKAQEALIAVHEGVDDAAMNLKDHLRLRLFNNEKAIMEQRLSRLYGKPITLQAMDGKNEIVPLAHQQFGGSGGEQPQQSQPQFGGSNNQQAQHPLQSDGGYQPPHQPPVPSEQPEDLQAPQTPVWESQPTSGEAVQPADQFGAREGDDIEGDDDDSEGKDDDIESEDDDQEAQDDDQGAQDDDQGAQDDDQGAQDDDQDEAVR